MAGGGEAASRVLTRRGHPGTYWWYASHSGDAANLPFNSGCGAGMCPPPSSRRDPPIWPS